MISQFSQRDRSKYCSFMQVSIQGQQPRSIGSGITTLDRTLNRLSITRRTYDERC
jgi:hypothetical protein